MMDERDKLIEDIEFKKHGGWITEKKWYESTLSVMILSICFILLVLLYLIKQNEIFFYIALCIKIIAFFTWSSVVIEAFDNELFFWTSFLFLIVDAGFTLFALCSRLFEGVSVDFINIVTLGTGLYLALRSMVGVLISKLNIFIIVLSLCITLLILYFGYFRSADAEYQADVQQSHNEVANDEADSSEYEGLYNLNVGDTIAFGSYEQDDDLDNGKEEMYWTVIGINDSKAELLCNAAIEVMQYNQNGEDVSWANSDIRQWLNGDFYESAFSTDEKLMIIDSQISTYSTRHPVDEEITTDKVFISQTSLKKTSASKHALTRFAEIGCDKLYSSYKSGELISWIRDLEEKVRIYAYVYNIETKEYRYFILLPDAYALVIPSICIDIRP